MFWGIIGGASLLFVVVSILAIGEISRNSRRNKEQQKRIEELALQVKQKDDDLGKEIARRQEAEKKLTS
ncbi:MAG: hypothetical protein ACE5GG_02505 [Candidatus Omnitrophota bacterium]